MATFHTLILSLLINKGNVGKNRVLLLLIGLCFTCVGAFASNIGLGHTTYSKDTVGFGDTLIITTSIINYDVNLYQGTVNITYQLNGAQNIDDKIFPDPLSGQVVNLPPGDSLPVYMHIIISGAYFLAGPDILVVWPICPDGTDPYNYVRDTIFVDPPTAITGTGQGAPQLKVYTVGGNIIINNSNPVFTLNRVRIFDILGHEISNVACITNHQQIDVAKQPDGIYLAEVELNTGQKAVFKVSKF
jgi:hypothetical protein